MRRWRAIAGAAVLGALVLPTRDQWRAGSFAVHTWGRLRSAGRGSPASDFDRELAQLAAPLAGARLARLMISPAIGGVDLARLRHQIQYALAPCIVVPSIDADFVIVVGGRGPATPEPDAAIFALVQESGDSLRLYRRRRR